MLITQADYQALQGNGHLGDVVGTIGVIHRGSVTGACAQSLTALQTPGRVKLHFVEGTQIAWQRNQIVEQVEGDWLLFVDTDQVFAPDALMRLLAHRAPIVGGLIADRRSPFWIAAGRGLRPLRYHEIPEHGLYPVEYVGTGFLLIRREIFSRLPRPWFALGQVDAQKSGEDIYFCQQAREAGIPMAVDCGVQVGHLTTATVWPKPGSGVSIEMPGVEPCVTDIEVIEEETHACIEGP